MYSEGVQLRLQPEERRTRPPVTFYAGFDTLKYNPGIGSPFAAFGNAAGSLPVSSVNAGIEFQPTSISVCRSESATSSSPGERASTATSISPMLPGATPLAIGGRRY